MIIIINNRFNKMTFFQTTSFFLILSASYYAYVRSASTKQTKHQSTQTEDKITISQTTQTVNTLDLPCISGKIKDMLNTL